MCLALYFLNKYLDSGSDPEDDDKDSNKDYEDEDVEKSIEASPPQPELTDE